MSNGMRSTELAVVVDSSHNLDGQVIEEQISSADKITYESGSASLKYVFDCWPPHGIVGRCLTWTLLVLLGWGAAIAIIGISALPGGNIFSLMCLFCIAVLGGQLATLAKLPSLMDKEWSSALRNIALVVILLRAGLGLDPAALKELSFMVLRLAFTPCIVETVTVATVTHLLLGFPWLWGLMLGFILSAVTPAVIVPCMIKLSEEGYGMDKGIPTLVIAASSVDDVLAISGFGVLMGITFAEGSLWWIILKGPIEVVMGLVYGLGVGALFWVLPNIEERSAQNLRFFLLGCAGLLAVFGSQMAQFGGAGALGCLVMAFVAGIGWRRQGMSEDNNPVDDKLLIMWELFQPFLFSLIGAEIQVSELDIGTVGWGLVTLAIGLVFRMATSFLVVMGGNLNIKERIFVALAWVPKATVQAAIGSQALDFAEKSGAGPEIVRLGEQVLTITVLVILITAPLGAVAIMLSAPKLLSKGKTKDTLDLPDGLPDP
ncbi:putative mitochondrial sodium/hydrogen exchanger 9B2-like [Penaeus vannamei]|uniref:Putative mitochondrial sodium/hydrogen exchanger 9B2-like n=1 Tax=Penaeus vannamei TaxID=6689 RepID=A0A423TF09_PENVA|nr:putative mitochondrial sodium/hydrogen exchanger 9B2-like [Penaeus vannamei]